MGSLFRSHPRESAVEVCHCTPEDFRAVEQITRTAFTLNALSVDKHLPRPLYGELFFESIVSRAMQQDRSTLLVAKSDGKVAGFIVYALDRALGRLCGVAVGSILLFGVDPEFRGRGVARALLRRVLQLFVENRMRLATVGTDSNNLSALQLYQDHGFRTRLNWTTWRWFPGWPTGRTRGDEGDGGNGLEFRPFTGEKSVEKLLSFLNRPLAMLRDRTVEPAGRERLLNQLRRKAGNKLAAGETMGMVAWLPGKFRSKPVGLLIWSHEERVERLYSDRGRMFRIHDLITAPDFRNYGVGRELLQALTGQAENCLFAEGWCAADDWPATNALAAAGFRPAHMATVLHCDLERNRADAVPQ